MQQRNRVRFGILSSLMALSAAYAQQCPSNWAPGMGVPGADNWVMAMKKWDPDGPGSLPPVVVLGGYFSLAGNEIGASRIATWDGLELKALGSGIVGGGVLTIVVDQDGDLVAGGLFSVAGDQVARNLAKWDGATWSEVGGGTSGVVNSIVLDADGNLVVGGNFLYAGNASHTHIAKWNGQAWVGMAAGIPGQVISLARGPANSVVAVASQPNSTAISFLWSWNGTAWVDITAANSSNFAGVATHPSGDVIVTGQVLGADWVRRWNGSTYTGMGLFSNSQIGAPIVLDDGSIFVLGVTTTTSSGRVIDGVAQYVNGDWEQAIGLQTTRARTLEKLDGNLLVGGNFTQFEGEFYWNNFAYKSDNVWKLPASGFDYAGIHAICELSNQRIVLGGGFTSVNGTIRRRIAVLNGSEFEPMGDGFNSAVYSIVKLQDGSLVAGGAFTASGSIPALRVARWDGLAWQPLGAGLDGVVYSLALAPDGTLYAGGEFNLSGGTSVSRVARWNGTSWSGLGTGVGNTVYSLCVLPGGELVAGGQFTTAGGNPASRIAIWTGFGWSALNSGCSSTVYSVLANPAGDLFAGGSFSTAGGIPAKCVAKWDGTWSQVGGGLYGGQVNSLSFAPDGNLIAAGSFLATNNRLIGSIARLEGGQWHQLGNGLGTSQSPNGSVLVATSLSDERILAGGLFSQSGQTITRGLAFFEAGTAPVISSDPVDTASCVQTTATFNVTVDSSTAVTYQWRKNSVDISAAINPSAATAQLQISPATIDDIGLYSCRISNDCGDVLTRDAMLAMCGGDFNCDQIVDFFDYLDFVDEFSAGGTRADFNGDNVVDFFDYLDFVDALSLGC